EVAASRGSDGRRGSGIVEQGEGFRWSEGSSGTGPASAFRPAISLAEGATERSFISNRYRAARAAVSASSSFMRSSQEENTRGSQQVYCRRPFSEFKDLSPVLYLSVGGSKHSARTWLLRIQPGRGPEPVPRSGCGATSFLLAGTPALP